ncbi:MAG: efflux RND transporter periplasmic adaptor subunit [Burkholderiales bacterium]|nr:efflux RND transporter periplasmic adaptor subunit [Burkholderiales bacterium]
MPRRLFVTTAALAVVLLAAFAAWRATRAPLVPAVSARMAPLLQTLQFSARVATASRVEVGSTLTGRVWQVAVAEGATVKPGEALVRLESSELRAALAQAEASERQAAARLAGLRSTGRSAAQAGVAQAESVLVAAQADLARTQELVAKGFLSEARLDEVRRAVAVAQAQLDAARAQRAANAEPGTDVAQAQAQVALASAARAAAQARLAEAVITAPAAARVLARMVEPGQIVQPGRALLSLALAGPLQLVAQVDERYLGQLQPGQVAGVRPDAYPAQRFTARVLSIAPVVDAQRGAIEVKFSLPQPLPAYLREDMTVSVEVETARREQALVLPADALRGDEASGPGVLLVRDGRVELRKVRPGLRTLDAVEILDGLSAGEAVLIGPAPAPGQRVRADTRAASSIKPSARTKEDAGAAMTNAMGR